MTGALMARWHAMRQSGDMPGVRGIAGRRHLVGEQVGHGFKLGCPQEFATHP